MGEKEFLIWRDLYLGDREFCVEGIKIDSELIVAYLATLDCSPIAIRHEMVFAKRLKRVKATTIATTRQRQAVNIEGRRNSQLGSILQVKRTISARAPDATYNFSNHD